MKTHESRTIEASLIECDDVEMTQEIQELAESIRERGLLHPIAVQEVNGKFVIKAGKKRFKACLTLGVTELPCIVVEGDNLEMNILQIEENLRRYNLPWYEIAENITRWHSLRQEQKGASEAKKGKAKRTNPGWSMRDTAEELGKSLGFVSEAIMLDRAVQRDPALRNIKDRDTAVRLVRAAAKRAEAELYAEAEVSFKVNQLYNGSSVDILKQFPSNSFHACITDPPWLKFIDEKLVRDDETVPVFKEVHRVLLSDAFLYMFVGFDDFRSYQRKLPEYGFTVAKTPLIWVKKELRVKIGKEEEKDQAYLHGVVLSRGTRAWEYSRDFELILVAVKGSPSLITSTQQSSIKVYPPLAPIKLTHPNEKPTELIVDLINDCTVEGSLVLDPFMGSGAHVEAFKQAGRRYIGIERDRTFYEQAVKRLKP